MKAPTRKRWGFFRENYPIRVFLLFAAFAMLFLNDHILPKREGVNWSAIQKKSLALAARNKIAEESRRETGAVPMPMHGTTLTSAKRGKLYVL